MKRRRLTSVALLLAFGLSVPGAHAAATFTIVNLDEGTGSGLDDPTPATPVGGNMGTTLGAQRLNAFQQPVPGVPALEVPLGALLIRE